MGHESVSHYLRATRARSPYPYTVAGERSAWSDIPDRLVLLGMDVRHREYIEADYEAAVNRLVAVASADINLAHRARGVGALVALHHESMGAWFATSLACTAFHVLSFTGNRPSYADLQAGMAADVLYRLDGCHDTHRINAAVEVIRSAATMVGADKVPGLVSMPCHPNFGVPLAFRASVVMKPSPGMCGGCGKRWMFERTIQNVATGANPDSVFVKDCTLLLTA